jgi:hypothetical protein
MRVCYRFQGVTVHLSASSIAGLQFASAQFCFSDYCRDAVAVLTLLLLTVTAFIALQGDQLEAKRYAARQACRFLHGLMQGERYCDDSNYTALRGQGDAELYRDDGHHAHPASKLLLLLLLLSVRHETRTIRMSMMYVYTQHARHCNHNKLIVLYSAATHSCLCASLSCVLVYY